MMQTKCFSATALAAVFAAFCVSGLPLPSAAQEGVVVEESNKLSFDAGADLRIRQEMMDNVPQMQNGMIGRPGVARGKMKNQMRFRPRVWAELKAFENWRLYMRLCDEFRWGVVQPVHNLTWPGEVVVDNLFIEGKGIFDDKIDVLFGRRDLYRLYGLSHIFVDGTSGDGSRTLYADMATITWHVDEDTTLDVFALFNKDREYMRFGTRRSHFGTQLTGLGGSDTEMDDWGWGAVWGSKIRNDGGVSILDYQLIAIQKNTASFHRRGVKHPRRQVNMVGTKVVPHWTQNFSTPLELYGQVGENGRDSTLTGWSAYAGLDWRDMEKKTWRPFCTLGLHVMSGDKDAMDQDGGHKGWDPMWYRGIDDSEMFLYGSMYGAGWWSNMYNPKATLGFDIGPKSRIAAMMGPMFAEAQDHCGGGNGRYKGFLSQLRWDFPLFPKFFFFGDGPKDGERFEMFGHILLEHFAPGDYYDTDKPAWFVRWQVDFAF